MTPAGIPDAWPQLLSKDQLCAYLGGMSWDTVKKILPIRPRDLGANVLRYSRPEVDAWIARLPAREPRLQESETSTHDAAAGEPPQAEVVPGPDARTSSLDRVRARTQRGPGRWKKAS